MNHLDAIEWLKNHFPNAHHLDAVNQGNKFEILVVDDSFEGKRAVARQQAIYAIFNDAIASGVIHALTIHALTPSEYQARQG